MAKTIQQSVTFKAKAARLYALYADSKLHSAATGQKEPWGIATPLPAGQEQPWRNAKARSAGQGRP